jgi:hypothetical protein
VIFSFVLAACTSSNNAAQVDDGGGAPDMASAVDGGSGSDGSAQLESVSFSYKPSWSGVTAVKVFGGFGQATDWDPKNPFLTLSNDGSGTFTGSAMLPAGSYSYLFQVVGDADGPTNYSRTSIDPLDPDFVQCPPQSPTAGADPNPCSVLTVPQAPAGTSYHFSGQVVYDGAAKAGYLVILERDEPKSHHFFANRVDSDASGNFDFVVAPGAWRVQVWHPSLLKMTDAQRDPAQLQALRRAISTAVKVSSTVTLSPPAELAYHDYDKMKPQPVTDGGVALPTSFVYTLVAPATTARACVFGGKPGFANIGDPWWTGATGTQTSASFDGTFNTTKATTPTVTTGQGYFWGTEEFTGRVDGGVTWTGESMVFPITWN